MAKSRPRKTNPVLSKHRLHELIEQATMDCYDEMEANVGFLTMIEDNVPVPFTTTVLGVEVQVANFDMGHEPYIVAICQRGPVRQRIPLVDLPLPSPPPSGSEWIEAYRGWLRGD